MGSHCWNLSRVSPYPKRKTGQLRRLAEKNIPNCAGFSFGFKARGRRIVHYVTVIATQKLNKRQSKVGKLFPVRCLIPLSGASRHLSIFSSTLICLQFRASQKNRTQKICRSLLDHWFGLTLFVENPEVPMCYVLRNSRDIVP